jgi:hypothetical protein
MKILMAMILISYLSVLYGCSPSAIRVTEEVIEDVAEEELERNGVDK